MKLRRLKPEEIGVLVWVVIFIACPLFWLGAFSLLGRAITSH